MNKPLVYVSGGAGPPNFSADVGNFLGPMRRVGHPFSLSQLDTGPLRETTLPSRTQPNCSFKADLWWVPR